MNPMDLKRGIDQAVAKVVETLKSRANPINTSDEIAQVGTISANGEREIGEMIAEAMQKVGKEGVITVEEAKSLLTELDVVEGMQFDRGYVSPYFVTNAEKMEAELDSPLIPSLREEALQPSADAAGPRGRRAAEPSAADHRRGRRGRGPGDPGREQAARRACASPPSRRRASAIAARPCCRTSRS